MNDVYIVDGLRTPFLKAQNEPGPFSAADLGVLAARALLMRHHLTTNLLSQVIAGCVGPREDETNIARIITLRLGHGKNVPAWTVQRNCASGLQAIAAAQQSILLKESDLILCGGCEAMSRAPIIWNDNLTRWLGRWQKSPTFFHKLVALGRLRPSMFAPIFGIIKGLTDPVVNMSMGQTAEELAYLFNINREEMDAFAVQSHQRSVSAQNILQDEIVPIYANNGDYFKEDTGIRKDSSLEKLKKLKPVFDKYGNITAGNSSQISDGAAFLLLANLEATKRHDLPILAKIIDIQWSALSPRIMGLGPMHAIAAILKRQNLTLEAIDHLEINEAFSAQVIACLKAFEDEEYCQTVFNRNAFGHVSLDKLNPEGGAIALGHPVGASGARLTLHAAKMLEKKQGRYAMISLCIGGGQGGAMLIEKVPA